MWLSQFSGFVVRWRATWFALVASLFLASFLLVSCSGFSFGGSSGSGGTGGSGNSSSPSASTTPSQLPLAKLHWCSKPFILFRDEHAPVTGTPVATATPTTNGTPAVTATGTG